jgi:putative transposase
MNELHFFNPYAESVTRRIVCRIGNKRAPFISSHFEREAWLRLNPEPWSAEIERQYHERFSGAIELWLDAGHGACLLRRSDCAQIVTNTMPHFEGVRVVMISFVVMPNHVHSLFVQNSEFALEKLLQSWKRFTTREINKLLDRAGSLWQRAYFDRLVRDEQHFANCVRYIRRNPEKARLSPKEFFRWESETALAIT